ncbi:MAG: hypothetical protein ACRC5N_00890, partial [Plesiomonas sp.]
NNNAAETRMIFCIALYPYMKNKGLLSRHAHWLNIAKGTARRFLCISDSKTKEHPRGALEEKIIISGKKREKGDYQPFTTPPLKT